MTTLSFPKPPGGTLRCPAGASPIIHQDRRTGEISAECYLPPTGGGDLQAVKNGILSRLSGERRSPGQVLNYGEENLLAAGRYEDPVRGLFLFKVAGLEMERDA